MIFMVIGSRVLQLFTEFGFCDVIIKYSEMICFPHNYRHHQLANAINEIIGSSFHTINILMTGKWMI